MRASRLLSILILLQLRGRLTAEDLAAEFEVSERTIYRDIDALSMAGVPVYGDRGPGGGFKLLEGYQTKLTGLDAEEAEAMPMMGMASAAAQLGLGAAAHGARNKMLSALPSARQLNADKVAQRVHFDPVEWYRAAEPLPHLPAIARAVLDQQAIAMRYESWKGVRDWRVRPLGLVMKAGVWYLVALGGEKAMIFRLSNMSDVEITDQPFDRPLGFNLAAWWQAEQARFEAELLDDVATLRVTALGARRLLETSPLGADAVRAAGPARDGWLELTMPVENSDHGARQILGLGAEVQVVGPADFRNRVRELALGILSLNERSKDQQPAPQPTGS
jgi:predicted DNA-binding transcriptional regulator YafY